MQDEWVEVGNCGWVHQALFFKSVLEAAGIDAIVPDEHTLSVQPLYATALGGVRVLVRESDRDKAREVLDSAAAPDPAGAGDLQQELDELAAVEKGCLVALAGADRAAMLKAASALAARSGRALLYVHVGDAMAKYIGETEKHLSRVFAEAEGSGAILFFDEADALFGRAGEPAAPDASRLLEVLTARRDAGARILLAMTDAGVLPEGVRGRIDRVLRFDPA